MQCSVHSACQVTSAVIVISLIDGHLPLRAEFVSFPHLRFNLTDDALTFLSLKAWLVVMPPVTFMSNEGNRARALENLNNIADEALSAMDQKWFGW